ncbi:hypothetical protein CPB83DRAFT_911521 [Crepidotus variabilis]|uniref:Arrestin-like N-terminal domain-containing protein n=1 Tax=Crepidotus variabilis TaxID=179855 RepID=A0A9P6JII7_9AGAR|nr:hypothetical protein CPB83DRAFT_911521 [Crepidotus variabilis]
MSPSYCFLRLSFPMPTSNPQSAPMAGQSPVHSDWQRQDSGLTAFFRRNRFSTVSTLTNASSETTLPEYSEVDNASTVDNTTLGSLDQPVSPSPALDTLAEDHSMDDTESSYAYPIGQEKPWAVLHLKSCLPSTPSLPILVGNTALKGSLALKSQSAESIQEIYITLKGKIQISSSDVGTETFFHQRFTIWTKTTGSSPLYSPEEGDDFAWAFEEKLESQRNFPFSIPVPTHVDFATKQAVFQSTIDPSSSVMPSLPSSFSETGIPVEVHYSAMATIVLGRFRKDGRIKAGVIYIRGEQPPPLSSLSRRTAYNTPISTLLPRVLPGPDIDPTGWDNHPKVTTHGFFQEEGGTSRWIEHSFLLSLALPRTYARGTVIPCYIQMSCADEVAVRYLGNPKAPCVRLVRRVTYTLPINDHLRTSSTIYESYL